MSLFFVFDGRRQSLRRICGPPSRTRRGSGELVSTPDQIAATITSSSSCRLICTLGTILAFVTSFQHICGVVSQHCKSDNARTVFSACQHRCKPRRRGGELIRACGIRDEGDQYTKIRVDGDSGDDLIGGSSDVRQRTFRGDLWRSIC
jgi:hypothetical protein